MACFGPSHLLDIDPNHFIVVLVGWFVLTFMQALCFISSLPEALESYQVKYRIIPGVDPALDGKLSDIMSSGYGFFYNLSSMIGPIIGGALFDKWGFVTTMDINMCASFVITIIFIIFNCSLKVFKEDK